MVIIQPTPNARQENFQMWPTTRLNFHHEEELFKLNIEKKYFILTYSWISGKK